MILNGYIQSGAEMIGAEVSSFFSLSYEQKHSLLKLKGTSSLSKLVKGLAIMSTLFETCSLRELEVFHTTKAESQ